MTIATTVAATGPYFPNGVTVAFPFTFDVANVDEVMVILLGSDGLETEISSALYTVTLAPGDDPGGTVTFAAAPAAVAGADLWVVLDPLFTQQTRFEDEGAFNQSILNPALDRAATRDIWLRDQISRSVRAPRGKIGLLLSGAANTIVATDESGNLVELDKNNFKGDPGGNVMSVGLATEVIGLNAPLGTNLIRTSGRSITGTGSGLYVSDALATLALYNAHPRAVLLTNNGRYFRLLPEKGMIEATALGVLADGVTDDRPAAVAGTDYIHAIGGKIELRLPSGTMKLVCPQRTHHTLDKYQEDGHLWPVRSSVTVSAIPGTLRAFRRAYGDLDPQANYQVLPLSGVDATPAVWRGGGFWTAPTFTNNDTLTLDGWTLDGGCAKGAVFSFPASTITGDGWDTTDKGLWNQDQNIGKVIMTDFEMYGFRGETVYFGGNGPAFAILNRCKFHTTNGDVFNPGGTGIVWATQCEFGNARQAIEALFGPGHRYIQCRFYKSDVASFAGNGNAPARYNYAWSERLTTAPPPWTFFSDCHFEEIPTVLMASWVRGNVRTTDSQISFSYQNGLNLLDGDLRVEAWIDRVTGYDAVTLSGPPNLTTPVGGSAPGGTFVTPPRGFNLHVTCRQTDYAIAQGNVWGAPFSWTGHVNKNITVTVDASGCTLPPLSRDSTALSFPLVKIERLRLSAYSYPGQGGFYYGTAISADTNLTNIRSPIQSLFGAAAGATYAITLPTGPSGGGTYPNGQRLRLLTIENCNFVFANAGNTRLKDQFRVLRAANVDYIEFVFDEFDSKWVEDKFYTTAGDEVPRAKTYAAAIALDARVERFVEITLTGNLTLNAPTNLKAGQRFQILLKQDATGTRTLTPNAAFKFAGAVNVLSVAANAVDRVDGVVRADNATIDCVLNKGFA